MLAEMLIDWLQAFDQPSLVGAAAIAVASLLGLVLLAIERLAR